MGRVHIFDWLRLLGALAVVLGHSYVLLDQPPPMIGTAALHSVGVMLFFFVSGYLITGSWLSDPHLIRFATKRALRIMPALLVVVWITTFVLGPLITSDTTYLWKSETWTYLWRNSLLLPFHQLPGVFESNPSSAVNGSLWTLPVEVFMYAMTPLLIFAGRWAALAFGVLLFLYPINAEVVGFGLQGASSVIPFYLLGACLRLSNIQIPNLGAYPLPADISYGVYLTAFPVQQTLIHLFPSIDVFSLTLGTLAIVAPLGWLSWIYVEKPMLGLARSRRAHMPNPVS